MATLFKKTLTRWYAADGKRVTAKKAQQLQAEGHAVEKRRVRSRKWYVRYRLPDGRTREVPGYTDKSATMALAVQLEKNAVREAAGLATPVDRYLADPVEKHLRQFVADLETRGRTADHIKKTASRIRAVLEACGSKRLAEIEPARVQSVLAEFRRGGMATETSNHHLQAVKSFTRWLWRQGRLTADPLAGLRKQNADPDRHVVRRAMTAEELARVVQAAEVSRKVFRGLSGADRAALYMLAAGSGLRAHELATLTQAHLLLDAQPPRLVVEAAYAKNRRQDVLPLPAQVAEYLRTYLASRPTLPTDPATRPLWPGTWYEKAAKMLRLDLEPAGIPYVDASGRVADFHSLRSVYATLLARQGVNLQTAQALLRHSDPKLTARTYTKLGVTDLGKAVAGLDLGLGKRKREADEDRPQAAGGP